LIADRSCDSERLRQEHSLELIVSNLSRRKRTQDGRPRAVATAGVGKSSGLFCLAEELLPYLQALGNAMPPTFSEWFKSDAR
jgi:hypothetical protein